MQSQPPRLAKTIAYGCYWLMSSQGLCECRVNPQGEGYYDGISLDPLEVMFIKFKRVLQQNKWGNVMQAGKYHEWLTEQVRAPSLHSLGA